MLMMTPEEIEIKLERFARWLSSHPGQWNAWPFTIPLNRDRDVVVDSMRAIINNAKQGNYPSFRVDRALLEIKQETIYWPENGSPGLILQMRIKA